MKAVVYKKYGSPEVLRFKDVQKPIPKENEVLIKIHATTVSAADVRMRKADPFLARIFNGLFSPKRVQTLGFELAGEIEETGASVTRFRKGDMVFATSGFKFGAYAEYICMPENGAIATIPAGISFEEAAAVPVGSITAMHFLKEKAKIQSGQEVLIYGASGSVGTYAIQLAKYYGANVTAVCSMSNIELVKLLQADNAIDYTKEDFALTGKQYDIIFDAVGKVTVAQRRTALAPNGKFVSVRKGDGMRSAKHINLIAELIEAGKLSPVIDRIYPFEQIVEAHSYVEKGHKKGNVVIRLANNIITQL